MVTDGFRAIGFPQVVGVLGLSILSLHLVWGLAHFLSGLSIFLLCLIMKMCFLFLLMWIIGADSDYIVYCSLYCVRPFLKFLFLQYAKLS